MDSQQIITRFESERQALALMNHPNIAQVYDAGFNSQGRPYFVMEWIEGRPVLEYCDQCQLTLRQRLQLFQRICAAIQHAHQKGIVHRDIKPSNLLMSEQDELTPKVIDFGIAKALDQPLTEHVIQTQAHQIIGTPGYMSPEQLEIGNPDIDTRADIYSLGVVLYELISGRSPYEHSVSTAPGIGSLRRQLLQGAITPPSRPLPSADWEMSTKIALSRRTTPERLQKELKGDLDWITMKALEPNREERYQNVAALSLDVESFLNQRPVSVAAPSKLYLARKFIVRHRVPLGLACSFLLLLIFSTVVTTWLALKNQEQKEYRGHQVYALDMRVADSALHEYHIDQTLEKLTNHATSMPGHKSLDREREN